MLDFLSPPKIVSDARDSLCLFILLSSEKNEPRSAAAVIGLLARRYGRRRGLRNSLRSNSPRPFPSVFLATSPPDKGGIGDCCFCLYSNPLCFINPSVLRTPPLYFAVQNTPQCCGTRQGECVRFDFVTVAVFSTPLFFQPLRPCGHLPYILRCKTQRRRLIVTLRSLQCDTPHTGHGKGRRLNTNDFLSLSKKVLVTLIRFICSFFSAARRTNQEAPPRLSGFWVCRRSRRRGLRNSLCSDGPRPFSSVFLATSPPDKGGDLIRAFDGLESF